MANDPRNLDLASNQPIESVHANPRSGTTTVFFRCLERVAGIEGGTGTSDFVESNEPARDWLKFYVRMSPTTGGDPHILKAYLSIYGVSVWGGVAGMFQTRIDTPLANGQVGNAGALDAWCTIGAGADTITGLLYGAVAMVGAEARAVAKQMTGTYYALFLASHWGTNVTVTDTASFIGLQDWGGGDAMPFFLDTDSITAAVGSSVETHSAVGATSPVFYLRVKCPNASVGYIPIYAQHQA